MAELDLAGYRRGIEKVLRRYSDCGQDKTLEYRLGGVRRLAGLLQAQGDDQGAERVRRALAEFEPHGDDATILIALRELGILLGIIRRWA